MIREIQLQANSARADFKEIFQNFAKTANSLRQTVIYKLDEQWQQIKPLNLGGPEGVSHAFFKTWAQDGAAQAVSILNQEQKTTGNPKIPTKIKTAMTVFAGGLLVGKELFENKFGDKAPKVVNKVVSISGIVGTNVMFGAWGKSDGLTPEQRQWANDLRETRDSNPQNRIDDDAHRSHAFGVIDDKLEKGEIGAKEASQRKDNWDKRHGY